METVRIKDLKAVQWHADLPEDAKRRIAALFKGGVGRHMSDTLEQWEHGFCHDLDFWAEIAVWERIDRAWARFARKNPRAAARNPGRGVATLAAISAGGDVSDQPFARQLLACYLHVTKEG